MIATANAVSPLPATVVYVDRGEAGNVMGIAFADPGTAAATLRQLAA